jgi:hypothetical protein
MENISVEMAREIVHLIRKYDATSVEKHNALDIVNSLNTYELFAMDTPIVLSFATA